MLEWLKSAWARWKVQVSFVGGALVVATAYGTCTYEAPSQEPEAAPEAPVIESAATTATENTAAESTIEGGEADNIETTTTTE